MSMQALTVSQTVPDAVTPGSCFAIAAGSVLRADSAANAVVEVGEIRVDVPHLAPKVLGELGQRRGAFHAGQDAGMILKGVAERVAHVPVAAVQMDRAIVGDLGGSVRGAATNGER
jgi:hypothetical protein